SSSRPSDRNCFWVRIVAVSSIPGSAERLMNIGTVTSRTDGGRVRWRETRAQPVAATVARINSNKNGRRKRLGFIADFPRVWNWGGAPQPLTREAALTATGK